MPKTSTYTRKSKTPRFNTTQSPVFFSDNEVKHSEELARDTTSGDSEPEEPKRQSVEHSLPPSPTRPAPLHLSSPPSRRRSLTVPPMSPIVPPMLPRAPSTSPAVPQMFSSAAPTPPIVPPMLYSTPSMSPTVPPSLCSAPPMTTTAPSSSAIVPPVPVIPSTSPSFPEMPPSSMSSSPTMPFCPPRSSSQSGSHPYHRRPAPPPGEVSPRAAARVARIREYQELSSTPADDRFANALVVHLHHCLPSLELAQEEWEEAISKGDPELEAQRKRVLDVSMNHVDNIYSMLSRLIPQHPDPKDPQIELLANQIRTFWERDRRWIRPTTHQGS